MNREIEFRGRSLSDDRWVYGYYVVHEAPSAVMGPSDSKDIHYIVEIGFADWGMDRPLMLREVDPATVGQFTGLKDSKRVKVYEGDILDGTSDGPVVVEWDTADFVCRFASDDVIPLWEMAGPNPIYASRVVGNIHQNRDLQEANA